MISGWGRIVGIVVLATCFHGLVVAQQPARDATADIENQVRTYASDFFSRYQPRTALDMVRQLPGFLLDDGDNTRGFGAGRIVASREGR